MRKIYVFTALLALTVSAQAQTFEGNNNVFETPLGMNSVTDIDGVVKSSRDENFNLTRTTQQPGWALSATAIGNLINVQIVGNNNSAVINATQINTGSQRASISTDTKQTNEYQ